MHEDSRARVRRRAHTILLSDQGHSRQQIADIYQTKADTVSDAIDAWEAYRFEGLYEASRSGRPPVLNEAEKARAIALIKATPRQIKQSNGSFISWPRRLARRSAVPR